MNAVQFPAGVRLFSLPLDVTQPEREANYSPPLTNEVYNA